MVFVFHLLAYFIISIMLSSSIHVVVKGISSFFLSGIMGGKGEGFSGTSIKDTWTKPKGGKIKGGKLSLIHI